MKNLLMALGCVIVAGSLAGCSQTDQAKTLCDEQGSGYVYTGGTPGADPLCYRKQDWCTQDCIMRSAARLEFLDSLPDDGLTSDQRLNVCYVACLHRLDK